MFDHVCRSDTASPLCVLSYINLNLKKQIHDIGTKVYLHTYNSKKRERDRLKKKKKNPGFRTRNLPRGRRTLSRLRLSYGRCFAGVAKQLHFSTAKNKHNSIMCVWKDKKYSIVRKEFYVSCFYSLVFSCLGLS